MDKTKQKTYSKIDWNALDKCWAEQYEEDYGNLYNNSFHNSSRINIAASNIEDGILISV